MGIGTVAVFSDADNDALFVRDADEAVRIGPPPSTESYLKIDRIVEAAKQTGADAIHPGYGFLAENAELAEACADAGVIFIGPTASAIRAMGSKQQAKAIVSKADVPVIPGYAGEGQADATLAKEIEKIGFPALVKASAGGGGKGMRVVQKGDDPVEAIQSARREAESSFGDGTLLIEKYIDGPRHVEIQILGDAHGNVVHLFERECSIQRRHQKIIEETPSVALDEELRQRMGQAAVAVGKAIGYQNAGTVEFILAPDKTFYFLEVNTRLQVEHPVTECTTGLDLVHEQIRVAEGRPLAFVQSDIEASGAAVEVRIYAEDPGNNFLPVSGQILDWHIPEVAGLRVDTGVETGSDVGIHYDPMLAKIIAHAPTRDEALSRLIRALRGASIQGIRTNRELLLQVLSHPEFVAGRFDTHFIDNHLGDALDVAPDAAVVARAAIAATLAAHEERRRDVVLPRVLSGYRNNRFQDEWVEYVVGEQTVRVQYRCTASGRFEMTAGELDGAFSLIACDPDGRARDLVIEGPDGHRVKTRVVVDGARFCTHALDGAVVLRELPRFPDRQAQTVPGGCIAPMPGKIVKVAVTPAQSVKAGDVLVVMEAMKMEHTVTAPHDGTIEELHAVEGEQVEADTLLAVVKSE
jgi:3-methylcrotonyl-CoA carboxylase alpha subunit